MGIGRASGGAHARVAERRSGRAVGIGDAGEARSSRTERLRRRCSGALGVGRALSLAHVVHAEAPNRVAGTVAILGASDTISGDAGRGARPALVIV